MYYFPKLLISDLSPAGIIWIFVVLQPADCKSLIEKLRNVAEERLLDELKAVKSWTFGKVFISFTFSMLYL